MLKRFARTIFAAAVLTITQSATSPERSVRAEIQSLQDNFNSFVRRIQEDFPAAFDSISVPPPPVLPTDFDFSRAFLDVDINAAGGDLYDRIALWQSNLAQIMHGVRSQLMETLSNNNGSYPYAGDSNRTDFRLPSGFLNATQVPLVLHPISPKTANVSVIFPKNLRIDPAERSTTTRLHPPASSFSVQTLPLYANGSLG